MKATLLLVFVVQTTLALTTKEPFQKTPKERFKVEITDWNHAERIFKGVLLYVRTDHYFKVFNFPGAKQ